MRTNPRMPHTRRRGVLLLIILGLLAMFGLVAVAFVVLTGHAMRNAKTTQRIEQYADSPKKTAEEAFAQAIRGSVNPASVIGPHGLLEDLFGNNPLVGTIAINDATPIAGGQLIEFTANIPGIPDPSSRVGCVLTLLGGPAPGESTRIVASRYLSTTAPPTVRLQVLAFEGIQTATLLQYLKTNTCGYLINGTPFSGTGFGFNPTSQSATLLDALSPGEDINGNGTLDPGEDINNNSTLDAGPPYALLPNPVGFQANTVFGYTDPAGPGGANEDYDAVDFQNMLLAGQVITNPATGLIATTPSLHRPALINFWYHRIFSSLPGLGAMQEDAKWKAVLQPYGPDRKPGTADDPPDAASIVALKRKIILRPLPEDHPNFTGSNPWWSPQNISSWSLQQLTQCWELYGPWDVDNDGDGQNDGIWVDIGLPVRSAPDGRLYKPLVSYLCVDLDGRLNLNAHGCLAQTEPSYYGQTVSGVYASVNSGTNFRFPGPPTPPSTALTPIQTAILSRGQGYGPAEINLRPLFEASGPMSLIWYKRLLAGDPNFRLDGRYGEVGVLPSPPPGNGTNWLGFNKLFDYPASYADVSVLTAYGSPPDLKGTQAIGLDLAGQPLYQDPLTPAPNSGQTVLLPDPTIMASTMKPYEGAKQNDPYELNLEHRRPRALTSPSRIPANPNQPATPFSPPDNPFSPAELERLLRPYDRDAGTLPNRLVQLAPPLAPPPVGTNQRLNVTTESSSVPCPSTSLPPHLRDKARDDLIDPAVPADVKQWLLSWLPGRHPTDLLTAAYYTRRRDAGDMPAVAMSNTVLWVKTYAPQLLPPDLLAGLKMNLNPPLGYWSLLQLFSRPNQFWKDDPANSSFNFDPSGGPSNAILARQRMARHLYVLMLLLYDATYTPTPQEAGLTPDQQKELTIRRLAQWAINAVCFETPDSVMVPFEYDVDPLTAQGWRVDGFIGISPLSKQTDDDQTYRRLVWGCKPPELLLTETAAFHDRRVADTDFDTNLRKKRTDPDNQNPPLPADPDLDQPRIPQGSAFFELYCARNPNNPVAPSDLYTYDPNTNRWLLDLCRMAPANPTTNLRYPVWRMVISESRIKSNYNNVLARLGGDPHYTDPPARPDSASLEPEQFVGQPDNGAFSLLGPAIGPNDLTNVKIERIVWFSDTPPTNSHQDFNRIYFNRTGKLGLLPGQYLMVGPRLSTSLGAIGDNNPNRLGKPAPQRISLLPMKVTDINGTDNYPVANTDIKPVTTMVVAGPLPTTWPANHPMAAKGIGISISEPLFSASNYYPPPDVQNPSTLEVDAYGDLDQLDTSKGYFRDKPLDEEDLANKRPLAEDNILQTQTVANYKTVFLQRLANPMEPYDREANPYLTVDWMPIDLTVFNGEDRKPTTWPPTWNPNLNESWDPYDGNPNATNNVHLESRQRGGPVSTGNYNIWAPATYDPTANTGPNNASANLRFRHALVHTLGFINHAYQDSTATPRWLTSASNVPPIYLGGPLRPFPWLTWNARPYVSQLELLLVPCSTPARLLSEYRFVKGNDNPYQVPATAKLADLPYPHLLNFFQSASTAPSPPDPAPRFHRLLEYVYVPSRFVGTEVQLNPDPAVNNMANQPHWFHTPFNRVSTYREPGRINLNTVFSPEVFLGLMNYFPDMNPTTPGATAYWTRFIESRRGYTAAAAAHPLLAMDPSRPTQFARPFRSSAGAWMVPPGAGMEPDFEVNVTLLRKSPNAGEDRPLFGALPTATPKDYDDPLRNPYFRYQGLQRLGNLVSTQSNVYAIWITVGYFEVEPNPFTNPKGGIDLAHPDGYALGQELGSDSGDVKRHRAFYIFDRSIPVGFQRGQDLNMEKAVLLRRFIE